MTTERIVSHAMSIIFSAAGYLMLFLYTRWEVCLAIFLLSIGNNIDERIKRESLGKSLKQTPQP